MTIVYFIVILGIIVLVHELGHLISAKAFNVYCKEFAIGFGPKIKSIQGKETLYSIRALPLGGFVSMAGESGVDIDTIDPKRTLKGIAPYKRIIIMLAGIFNNILLAYVIFVVLFMIAGSKTIAPQPVIAGIVPDSAAEHAGFLENDRIVSLTFSDGFTVKPTDFYEVIQYAQLVEDEIIFKIDRNGSIYNIPIKAEYNQQEDRFMLGFFLPSPEFIPITFFSSFTEAFDTIVVSVVGIFTSLSLLVRGIGLQAISGPIGIYDVTAQQAQAGLASLVLLTAILSLNIGVFNLLPLPILDGGRVIITLIEWIIGRTIPAKVEQQLLNFSVLLILMLMIFVTWQDIIKLFG